MDESYEIFNPEDAIFSCEEVVLFDETSDSDLSSNECTMNEYSSDETYV